MKKILNLIVLLSCMLVGCKTSPERDFIVSKANDAVQQRLEWEASLEEIESYNKATPSHWSETVNIGRFKFIFDTEILRKLNECYPVFQVAPVSFSDSQISAIFRNMLGEQYEIRAWKRTHRDIEMELQSIIESRELIGDEQYDIDIARLQQEMDQLETEPEFIASEEFRISLPDQLEIRNNEQALYANLSTTHFNVWVDQVGMIQLNSWLENEPAIQPPISKEVALEMSNTVLQKLNATGFSIAHAEPARICELYIDKTISNGWFLTYTKTEGYYLGFDPGTVGNGLLQIENDAYAKPIQQEKICVFISDSGCRFISWESPMETIAIKQQKAVMLPFDQVREEIIKLLTVGCSWRQDKIGLSDTMYVEQIILSSATVRIKDDANSYYLMPIWIVVYQEESDIGTAILPTYIAVNAIDGSRIDFSSYLTDLQSGSIVPSA